MRAFGLFLLLAGSLILLWPYYGHFIRPIHLARSDTQLYGGMTLMAGIISIVLARIRAG